ncbi:hypothetical protein BH11BAC6_BH11BAC6_03170 [soil metagenome]
MKKTLLLLSMIAFTAAIANVQNTFPATGNAGIGTLSPAAPLQVIGASRFGSTANYGSFDASGNLIFTGTSAYKVAGNKYAFQYSGNPNYGLFFNSTNVRYEFRNGSAVPVFYVGANDGSGVFSAGLQIGNSSSNVAGTLRWNGTNFEGYNGTLWVTLGGGGGAETDPEVGANTTSFIPRWNGTALVTGLIQDNGSKIGINKAPDIEHRLSVLRQASSGSLFATIYSAVRGESNASGSSTINSVGYLGVNNPSGMYPLVFPSLSFDEIAALGVKRNNTIEGAGVYGWNQGGAGSNYGVFGASTASSGNNYGVYGKTIASNTALNHAVYGEAQNGVANYGVYGKTTTASGQFGYAVSGSASGAGTNYAIFGTASGGATNYAGFFSGRVYMSDHLSLNTTSNNVVLNISGDNKAIEVDGTNPYLQMKSLGNDVGYIRANITNLEVATNAGTAGNLVLRTNGGERMTIGSNGRIGVNTVITPAQFNVSGTNETVNIDGSNPYLQINNGGALTGYIRANGSNFQVATNAENDLGKLEFRTNGSSRMWIDANGNVSVGGSGKVATGYLLSVVGKVMAEEVRVELNGTWPDYVFSKDYKLMPLQNLKQYVNENNHLPEVPAAEAMKDGIEVGKMNKMLMQKVEELTLYVIQLNEELQALKNQHK